MHVPSGKLCYFFLNEISNFGLDISLPWTSQKLEKTKVKNLGNLKINFPKFSN